MNQEAQQNETVPFYGVIRPLHNGDIDALRPILETWIRLEGHIIKKEVDQTLQAMRESITGMTDRTYFVAEEDGNVVGVMGMRTPDGKMVQFATTSKPIELINAFVSSERRRGSGVGRALVTKIEQAAKERGYTEVQLNSGPRYEETGWGFYDAIGYTRIALAHNYYGPGRHAPVWQKLL